MPELKEMATQKPRLNPPKTDLDRFVYAISHDLNEPLRMVTSFIKLAQSKTSHKDASETEGDYLSMALDNANQMKKMISALVDLSRVSRSTELATNVFPETLLTEVNSMYQAELDAKGILLEYDCSPPVQVIEEQLITVFKVLIQNILDHASEEVECYTMISKDAGDFVEFVCEAEKDRLKTITLNQIFDVFARGNRREKHIGMGLTLARAIIEHNGGEMWAVDQKNFNIHFTLPKAQL
jgi:chemotaxis family two-component system sensor kinase Cph1